MSVQVRASRWGGPTGEAAVRAHDDSGSGTMLVADVVTENADVLAVFREHARRPAARPGVVEVTS